MKILKQSEQTKRQALHEGLFHYLLQNVQYKKFAPLIPLQSKKKKIILSRLSKKHRLYA